MNDVLAGILYFIVCMALPYIFFYFLHPYNRNLRKGVKSINSEQDEDAVIALTKCLKGRPSDLSSLIIRAQAYANLSQFEKAEEDITKALSIKPNNIKVLSAAGYVYLKLKNYSYAISFLDAILMRTESAWAYGNRGVCYIELGKYDLAIQDIDKAIQLDASGQIHYNNKGFCYICMGEYEKALQVLNYGISLNLNNPHLYYNRGFAYAHLKNFKKAFEDYEKSYAIDDQKAYLYKYRGITYIMTESYKEAREDLEKAISLDGSLRRDIILYLEQLPK